MYIHVDNADSTAATIRNSGGGSLVVDDGSKFGSPSPSTPLRVSINRDSGGSASPITILKCVGRSGNTLTIDGTADGYADANVEIGDQVVASWTAGAVAELADAIAAKINAVDAVSLADEQTISGAKTLVAAKLKGGVKLLDSVGSTVGEWDEDGNGFPTPITFRLAQYVDLADGTNLTGGGALVPYSGKIAKVLVKAAINGAAGGFSLQIKRNGTAIFASPITVASSDTATKTFTTFAADTLASGDEITIDATSAGTGVQGVHILLVPVGRNR